VDECQLKLRIVAILALLFAPWFLSARAEVSDLDTGYRTGSVARADGGTTAYYERAGNGPVLVLIPGSWDDHSAFDPVVRALNSTYRVIIVELPGHGKSLPPADHPTMAYFADCVFRVSDALEIGSFIVGGHSIGGMIAIEMAEQRPSVIRGIVPIEGWSHYTVSKDAFNGQNANTLTSEMNQIRESNRKRTQAKMTQAQIDAFSTVWKQWDGDPTLRLTQVPVLQIWGDRGRPIPSRKAMRIPERENITLHWVSGASHWLLLEKPDQVARAIDGFVSALPEKPRK